MFYRLRVKGAIAKFCRNCGLDFTASYFIDGLLEIYLPQVQVRNYGPNEAAIYIIIKVIEDIDDEHKLPKLKEKDPKTYHDLSVLLGYCKTLVAQYPEYGTICPYLVLFDPFKSLDDYQTAHEG